MKKNKPIIPTILRVDETLVMFLQNKKYTHREERKGERGVD